VVCGVQCLAYGVCVRVRIRLERRPPHVCGGWCVVCRLVFGVWCLPCGVLWSVGYGVGCECVVWCVMAYSVWCIKCGVWCVVLCGVWCLVFGVIVLCLLYGI